jgi:hypothetical protein
MGRARSLPDARARRHACIRRILPPSSNGEDSGFLLRRCGFDSCRGFEIETRRERALGGWSQLFWSIFRISDGWEFDSGFFCGGDTVRELAASLKERVGGELADMGADTADAFSVEEYELMLKEQE